MDDSIQYPCALISRSAGAGDSHTGEESALVPDLAPEVPGTETDDILSTFAVFLEEDEDGTAGDGDANLYEAGSKAEVVGTLVKAWNQKLGEFHEKNASETASETNGYEAFYPGKFSLLEKYVPFAGLVQTVLQELEKVEALTASFCVACGTA